MTKILLEKEFNKDLVDKEKIINTRLRCFNGKVITDFHDNKKKEKTPNWDSFSLCFPEIVLDSVFRMKNNGANYKYFRQIYFEQCKSEEMKTKDLFRGVS